MYNWAFRVSLVFFCCLNLGSQPQTASSGAIAGIVVNGANNSPIRRAIITLSTVEPKPQDAVAWTGNFLQFRERRFRSSRLEKPLSRGPCSTRLPENL